MTKNARILSAALAVCAAAAGVAQAEAKRGLGAHAHGLSKLSVAVEGGAIVLELEAPGVDIVGFEHAAETDADKAKIQNALAALKKPAELFEFVGGGCSAKAVEAELHVEGGDHEGHDDGHDHSHDHGHDHGEEKAEEAGHTEFEMSATLTCSTIDGVTALNAAAFFETFPSAGEIEAALVSDKGAREVEMTKNAPSADLPTGL